jgi:hypothetical protein
MSDFILVVLAIILLFSFFRRYILLFVLNAISKKLFKNFSHQQQSFNQQQPQRPQGSVTINPESKSKSKNNRNDNDEGEYVDYEEVK